MKKKRPITIAGIPINVIMTLSEYKKSFEFLDDGARERFEQQNEVVHKRVMCVIINPISRKDG